MEVCMPRNDIGDIEVGNRCLYGVIVHVWDDPDKSFIKWVLIKNDSTNAPKHTVSFYRYRSDMGDPQLSLSHFIPISILKELSYLSEDIFHFGAQVSHEIIEREFEKKSKKKKKAKKSSTSKKVSPVIEEEPEEDIPIVKEEISIKEEVKTTSGDLPFTDIFASLGV
jgi:hypothetical protein